MTDPQFRNVLVIGGTGMLAAASRWIARHADHMTLAGRTPEALAGAIGATALKLDWADRPASLRVLDRFRSPATAPDLLMTWLHDAAIWLAEPAERCLGPGARSIRVHGALSADPDVQRRRDPDPRGDVHRQTVILGWHPDPAAPEGRRWLADTEISDGVIHAVRTPSATRIVVGTVAGS